MYLVMKKIMLKHIQKYTVQIIVKIGPKITLQYTLKNGLVIIQKHILNYMVMNTKRYGPKIMVSHMVVIGLRIT